jgi:radical SAM superfamily enzyme YgiQ (UPF0313 family)
MFVLRVLLISANQYTQPYPVYPLGLDYVMGVIAKRHQIQVIDYAGGDGEKALDTVLTAFHPDVVGISLRNIDNVEIGSPQTLWAHVQGLISQTREKCSACIVLGGSGFSMFPKKILAISGADYGILGEGERFGPFLNALENGTPLESLPGVVTQDMSSPKVPTPFAGQIERQLLFSPEPAAYYLQNSGILNLQTKRGCPFSCVYCTYPYLEGRTLRCFDPRTIADEARRLQEAGARFLFIVDSVFNSNEEHSLAVADAFIKAGVSIPWGGFFSPLPASADYYPKMAQAGMTHVEFGTDSLSNSVLKAYGKPFRAEDIFSAHKHALDAGLNVAHYLLLGGPGETTDTLARTLDRADQLEKTLLFFFEGIRLYPNTRLYDIALQEELIQPGQDLLQPTYYSSPRCGKDQISSILKEKAQGRANWVIGSGRERFASVTSMLYRRGHAGPLWEKLIN